MRKRMMAAVPKASVLSPIRRISPSLEYERGMNAPVCVAKGVDLIARKIRDVAREHDVPVVENPRSPGPCTARSRWTRKSRPNITGRSPKSSATSCICAVVGAARPL
jgi:hypothetical protein